MDALTAIALTVALAAVVLYALYWVIRRAVAAGIEDAREASSSAVDGGRDPRT